MAKDHCRPTKNEVRLIMNNELSLDIDFEIVIGFLDETSDMLAEINQQFIEWEQNPGNLEIVNSIFRPFHSIKGSAPFFGLHKLKTLAHEMESVLALARKGNLHVTPEAINTLLSGLDEINLIVSRVRNRKAEIEDNSIFDSLVEKIKNLSTEASSSWDDLFGRLTDLKTRLGENEEVKNAINIAIDSIDKISKNFKTNEVSNEKQKENLEKIEEKSLSSPQDNSTAKNAENSAKTMRIKEERLDVFLSYVGELLTVGEMLNQIQRTMALMSTNDKLAYDLQRCLESFHNLSQELQTAIMEIRKVSIKSLTQKVPRLIRDIAAANEKSIEVKITGEEIEIDKSLLELLDAPLTHMARNAADHGIESPEIRKAAGKNPAGKIALSIVESEKFIELYIEDDGAGLNYPAIQKKAEALGLITAGQNLTEKELIDFMFMAGVSTAQKVTDVSGRGVGMDAVKKKIESSGGVISVKTTQGKGTLFGIKVKKSVTTEIISGFIVKADTTCYVIPLDRINDTFKRQEEDVTHILDTDDCISRNGEILPLLTLSKLLGKNQNQLEENQPVVTLCSGETKIALAVDEIVGISKFVLKPIDLVGVETNLLQGGALMGDGTVALVLNTDRLCRNSI